MIARDEVVTDDKPKKRRPKKGGKTKKYARSKPVVDGTPPQEQPTTATTDAGPEPAPRKRRAKNPDAVPRKKFSADQLLREAAKLTDKARKARDKAKIVKAKEGLAEAKQAEKELSSYVTTLQKELDKTSALLEKASERRVAAEKAVDAL